MSRDVKQVTKTRKETSGNASTSFKEQNISMILFEPRSQDGVPRIHGDISPTLNTAQGGQRQPCVVIEKDGKCNAARRLTPRECERLQGFPDGWTDIGEWIDSKGKKHKDTIV